MKFQEQEKSTFEKKFVTGPAVYNNILINPTAKEAQEYGLVWITEDPVYISETEEDKKKADIVVYCRSVDDPAVHDDDNKMKYSGTINSFKITLVADHLTSKTGKTQYINNKGVTSWVEDEKDLPGWFKEGEFRKSLKGEEMFYKFMLAFNNLFIKDASDSILEDQQSLERLFKGDFSELKQANKLPDNEIKLLSYVEEYNEKHYNRIYTLEFFRHWEMSPYLYESKEKKGRVDWEYYINYITNVDPNSRFNPDFITTEPKVVTLSEVKKAIDDKLSETPNVETPQKTDDLPF